MKKRKILIIVMVVAVCVVAGVMTYPVLVEETGKSNREESTESVISAVTQSSETSFSNEISSVDVLTEEDKAVKTEIAKHCQKSVDFRHKKQEVIEHQKFELTFFGVEEFQGKKELIAYKNDLGDEFLYKADTGKLHYAQVKSAITEKSQSSIDITTAQKVAEEYVSKCCDISEYVVDVSRETGNGYEFSYRRYICNYKTTDVFVINIGFSGEITYIIDNTDVFNDINIAELSINENLINSKVAEIHSYFDENMHLDEDLMLITIKDGKLQLRYQVKQGNNMGTYHMPLE